MVKQKTTTFIFLTLSLGVFICCGTNNYTPSNGESVPVVTDSANADTAPQSLCIIENDCDDDGVFTSCDDDDDDNTNIAIKDGCDGDADGFVDVYCVDENLSRDLNEDGRISADERDVNCDTCPGTSDPLQTDSDEDGYGDACGISADINISDEAPTTEDPVDDNTAGSQDSDIEGSVAITLVESESPVEQNTSFDISIELTNNTNQENFVVEVLLQSGSSTKALSGALEIDIAPTKTITFVGSCAAKTADCTSLGEDEITFDVGSTLTLETSHTIPESLDTGRYTVRIQVIYVSENGSETIVGRNGSIMAPSMRVIAP